jgi:hypothetical protein
MLSNVEWVGCQALCLFTRNPSPNQSTAEIPLPIIGAYEVHSRQPGNPSNHVLQAQTSIAGAVPDISCMIYQFALASYRF